jgi:hypothetical protein
MARDYYSEFTGTDASDRLRGGAGGALKGAGTGALIGSIVPGVGTVIGAGIGAGVGGAFGAGGATKYMTPYEEENLKRLTALEKGMEEGTLGLSEEEKQLLYGSAEDREGQARDQARMLQQQKLASAYQGAGTAYAEMAEAEEMQVDAMRQTGLKVAELDIQRAEQEEAEYWGRLATMSQREALEHDKKKAENAALYEDFNEFLVGEITTGGVLSDSGMEGKAAALASRYGTSENDLDAALEVLSQNPELVNLLIQAGG